MSIRPISEFLTDVQAAFDQSAERSRLRYVNALASVPQDGDKITWVRRNIDMGLAPFTSSEQSSPVIGQGNYVEIESTAVESRFVKAFVRSELENLNSPDGRFRVSEEDHIAAELFDQMRRALDLQEMVAQDLVTRGALDYVETIGNQAMAIHVALPGFNKVTLANAAALDTTGKASVDAAIDDYWTRNSQMPEFMRMSRTVWRRLQNSTDVAGAIDTFLRISGAGGIPSDGGNGGVYSRKIISAAFDWPMIEVDDASTTLGGQIASGTATSSFGAGKTLVLDRQIYGIRPGDVVLYGFNTATGEWNTSVSVVVTGVSATDGRTLTVTNDANLAVGTVVAVKARFLPSTHIQLGAQERANMEWRLPRYGMGLNGDVPVLESRAGLTVDAFPGSEPGITMMRRVWNKFGIRIADVRKLQSIITV